VGEKLDRGLTLHSRALKSLGVDREEEMDEREKEFKDAIARSQRIKNETQIDVPWQHFCGLKPAGSGNAITINEEPPKKDDKNKKDNQDD
jgi:hypothetical protein